MSSLIPDKPLVVSPTLAATIGLEEAVMLQLLHECMVHRAAVTHNGFAWLELDHAAITALMPFWQAQDIQRVATSLRDKGIIIIASAPFLQSQSLKFAFNEKVQALVADRMKAGASATAQAPVNPAGRSSANLIAANWQPGDEVLKQLAQLGIPGAFAREQVPEFVTYWRGRNESHHSWEARFLKQVVRLWRERETVFAAQQSHVDENNWRPSEDALEILLNNNIGRDFIDEAIPEFVLYWRERGESVHTWNSKFVEHVKRLWAKVNHALKHDSEPRPISDDWQPDPEVYEVLDMAGIDRDFARQLVPEFVLYWKEAGGLKASWNSAFVQQVKYHWAKRQQNDNADQRDRAGSHDTGFIEKHTDSSWREGL